MVGQGPLSGKDIVVNTLISSYHRIAQAIPEQRQPEVAFIRFLNATAVG